MEFYTKEEWRVLQSIAAAAPAARKKLAEVAKRDFSKFSASQIAAVEELCSIAESCSEIESCVREMKRLDPTLKSVVQSDARPAKRSTPPPARRSAPVVAQKSMTVLDLPIPRGLLAAAGWIDERDALIEPGQRYY